MSQTHGLNNGWLVIGPGSMVGSRFVELLNSKFPIYGAGSSNDNQENLKLQEFNLLDLTDSEQVMAVIGKTPADYLINFAAATLVDEIEKSRPQNPSDEKRLKQNIAYRVNVLGTKNLLTACKKSGKFPVFISTDFVFDSSSGPFSEDDEVASSPNGVSWYGFTKALAEKAITASGIDYLIIRISYPYRKEFTAKEDFARNFLHFYDEYKAGQREGMYPVFTDQILTPTFIDDLPEAIMMLVQSKVTGIFHITSPILTTPYQFACCLLKTARGVEKPEQLIPQGSIKEFQASHPELAKRLIKGGLKCDKISRLGFKPTTWQEGIKVAFSNG